MVQGIGEAMAVQREKGFRFRGDLVQQYHADERRLRACKGPELAGAGRWPFLLARRSFICYMNHAGVAEADSLILMVDGQEGLQAGDFEILSWLRQAHPNKKVVLAVNK